jgi:hypothetical protein
VDYQEATITKWTVSNADRSHVNVTDLKFSCIIEAAGKKEQELFNGLVELRDYEED